MEMANKARGSYSLLLASTLVVMTLFIEAAVAGGERRQTSSDLLPADFPKECISVCQPYTLKLEACGSMNAKPGSKKRLGCECENSFFETWLTCASCSPETYDSYPGQLTGVAQTAIAQCEAAGLPVIVDMSRISDSSATPTGSSMSSVRDDDLVTTTKHDHDPSSTGLMIPGGRFAGQSASLTRETETGIPTSNRKVAPANVSSSTGEEEDEKDQGSNSSARTITSLQAMFAFTFSVTAIIISSMLWTA